MSTVHSPYDPRILRKQCATLVDAGYEVVLIIPHDRTEIIDGVRIQPVVKARGRFHRMTVAALKVLKQAIKEHGDIYHIHDPELIPYAACMSLVGKKVIYDVHEDYVSSIMQKRYIPVPFRWLLAVLLAGLEKLASWLMYVVIAEKYYRRRFPNSESVLNYPLIERGQKSSAFNADSLSLLYTGNISKDRGAIVHARIVAERADIKVHMIGKCTENLADEMRQAAGSACNRLSITGVGEYVPYEQIKKCYAQRCWLAGLAIFPRSPHYVEKELTKFFEYMQAGLPVICSNFPTWTPLIEGEGVGICVEPDKSEEINRAIDWLREHPNEARAMGERGQKVVSEKYNWNVEGQKLIALYEKIVSS